MRLNFKQIKEKMPEITALLFTHPVSQEDGASEIWIKFRKDGVYACISFEQPFPAKIKFEKLVGAGDALNCSEAKKDVLNQYSDLKVISDILEASYDFKYNIKATVLKVEELFSDFNGMTLFG